MAAPEPPRGKAISLADALLALQRLGPRDAQTRSQVLALLGVEPVPASVAPPPRIGPWVEPERIVPRPPDTDAGIPPPPPPPSSPQPLPRQRVATLERIAQGVMAFAADESATAWRAADGHADSLPPPPLIAERQSRAILGAALAGWQEGAELDVERTIALLSRGRRIERLPRRTVRTLAHGAQVLVDRAPAMVPFAHDVARLLDDVQKLLGPGRLAVQEFRHCPARGVRMPGRGGRSAWRPPPPGTPVVIVSDLGIGAPIDDDAAADSAEWQGFAEQVRGAGCRAIAWVPFAPARWPPALTRELGLMHWGERTTARQVVRALRETTDRRWKA
ncbi:MAG: hypothetical protein JNL87_07545 [Burkholderiaceae bacterium]|nr:hypothetical protein [Burkholderiaceae bacterium]